MSRNLHADSEMPATDKGKGKARPRTGHEGEEGVEIFRAPSRPTMGPIHPPI